MPLTITLSLNKEMEAHVKSLLKDVPQGFDRAVVSAVNRTAAWGRTRVIRELQDVLPVQRKYIADRVDLISATARAPLAIIRIKGKRIALHKLRGRPLQPLKRRKPARPVEWQKRAGGPIDIAATELFVAKVGRGGHVGIFKRKPHAHTGPGPRHGLPIHELYGPSLPQVVTDSQYLDKTVQIDLSERLVREVESQVSRFLNVPREAATALVQAGVQEGAA